MANGRNVVIESVSSGRELRSPIPEMRMAAHVRLVLLVAILYAALPLASHALGRAAADADEPQLPGWSGQVYPRLRICKVQQAPEPPAQPRTSAMTLAASRPFAVS